MNDLDYLRRRWHIAHKEWEEAERQEMETWNDLARAHLKQTGEVIDSKREHELKDNAQL